MNCNVSLRVLVVDDEIAVADSLAMILQTYGYQVLVCYCAEHAIIAGTEFAPQVVISDVVMPGMNGIELADYYAAHHPDCKVLLISGNVATCQLADAAAAQGRLPTLMAKPVHPAEILRFIAACGLVPVRDETIRARPTISRFSMPSL